MSIDDDKIDPLLREWRKGLDCQEEQRARMRERVLASLPPVKVAGQSRTRSWKWIAAASFLGLSASILILLSLYQRPLRPIEQVGSELTSLDDASIPFGPEDLVRSERIAAEMDRLFASRVKAVSLIGDRLGLHFEPETVPDDVMEKGPRVLLRFELQRLNRNASQWETLHREEVIGHRDHQLDFSPSSDMNVHYWSHLLPDKSLWIEVNTSLQTKEPSVQEIRCLANKSYSIWTDEGDGTQTRLLFVFELLDSKSQGVI